MSPKTPPQNRPLIAIHRRIRPDTLHPPTTTTELLTSLTPFWWGTALLFYGLGDLLTTLLGLQLGTIAEASPVAIILFTEFGQLALLPLKLGLFVLFYGLWYCIPAPHNVGVPLGLATIGIMVTVWNTLIILLTLS